MKNILIRALSGTVYVALLVGAVVAGGGWLLALLVALALLATNEYLSLVNHDGKSHRVCNLYDYGVNVALVCAAYFMCRADAHVAKVFVAIVGCCIVARMIAQLYAIGGQAIAEFTGALSSYVYIGLSLAAWPLFYAYGQMHLLLACLIFIWVNDTGAFCVGSAIGKHKLFERVSPKKSWEGFFGGVVFCIVAAAVMHYVFSGWYGSPMTLGDMIKLAVVVAVFATFGDLIESILKRSAGVKDSGRLIPGHGGILDRIDSLLVVIPVAALYLFFIS